MQTIINKLKINYSLEDNNSGEFVLFLHGWGGSIASFKGLQQSLTGFNTLNVDLCGFGESDPPPEGFDVYDYAEIVIKLLNKLKIKKVNIVSHSFGGRLAIIIASLKPKLVNKLVLIDSAGLKPRFNLLTYFKIKKYKLYKFLVSKKLLKTKKLKKFGSADYKALDKISKKVFNNIISEHLDFLVKDIFCPTLILWGKKDKTTPLYMAKKLNEQIKNSGLVVFKKAGHYSYLNNSRETFLIINNFFKSKEN